MAYLIEIVNSNVYTVLFFYLLTILLQIGLLLTIIFIIRYYNIVRKKYNFERYKCPDKIKNISKFISNVWLNFCFFLINFFFFVFLGVSFTDYRTNHDNVIMYTEYQKVKQWAIIIISMYILLSIAIIILELFWTVKSMTSLPACIQNIIVISINYTLYLSLIGIFMSTATCYVVNSHNRYYHDILCINEYNISHFKLRMCSRIAPVLNKNPYQVLITLDSSTNIACTSCSQQYNVDNLYFEVICNIDKKVYQKFYDTVDTKVCKDDKYYCLICVNQQIDSSMTLIRSLNRNRQLHGNVPEQTTFFNRCFGHCKILTSYKDLVKNIPKRGRKTDINEETCSVADIGQEPQYCSYGYISTADFKSQLV